MRITGGRYRGRIVVCPPGEIRPAMDRMRESMFSILGDISGCSLLDLFSGSGIIALEAFSRGVNMAMLVEKDSKKRATLLKNMSIASAELENGQIVLLIRPVERILRPGLRRFDLVYIDPPFAMKDKPKLLELSERADQPAPGGTLIMHHPSQDVLPLSLQALRQYDVRAYGQSILSFYTRDD